MVNLILVLLIQWYLHMTHFLDFLMEGGMCYKYWLFLAEILFHTQRPNFSIILDTISLLSLALQSIIISRMSFCFVLWEVVTNCHRTIPLSLHLFLEHNSIEWLLLDVILSYYHFAPENWFLHCFPNNDSYLFFMWFFWFEIAHFLSGRWVTYKSNKWIKIKFQLISVCWFPECQYSVLIFLLGLWFWHLIYQ